MVKTKLAGSLLTAALVGLYGWTEGAFCIPKTQTRIGCEDHLGYCSFLAYNYKIYFTKNYNCCYNDQGVFTHKVVTGTAGPTPPTDGDCCQSLYEVSFDDGQWSLPCPQTQTPPDPP